MRIDSSVSYIKSGICQCCGVQAPQRCGCGDSVAMYMTEPEPGCYEVECDMHRTKRWAREAQGPSLLDRLFGWIRPVEG